MRAALTRAPLFLFAALGLAAAALLARDMATMGFQVPLDPNEGWNAYHALGARAGQLYPPAASDGWMTNNYPPLSFTLIGLIGGDAVIAGRMVSLLAFAATGFGVIAVLRRMGCDGGAVFCGAVTFAAGMLIGSNYVAMDDPQLLGHAVQVWGLWLMLRRRPVWAGLLFAAGLFVKHNLVALPVAAALWLALEDRRAAVRLTLAGGCASLLGLALFRFLYGLPLWQAIAAPRGMHLGNLEQVAGRFLSWSGMGLAVAWWLPRGRAARLVLLYGGVALAVGLALAAGDGVDVNIFFDAAIALALAAGLAQSRFVPNMRATMALAVAVPLLLYGAQHFTDDDFVHTPDFRRQAAGDIAFLHGHPGPAACEMLSLCYWAGKDAQIDVFNSGEAIAQGARDPAPLAAMLAARRFSAVQFDTLAPFALGPQARAALLARYRVDHSDDNGVFLVPR